MTVTNPPLIGITTRRISPSALGALPAGLSDAWVDGVFTDYEESISGAGGIPVLITRSVSVPDLVRRLDGLVLSGGEDVEPELYGSAPGPHATERDLGRDQFEVALIHEAINVGLPILAICRGVQILNVALGGTLVSHLTPADGFSHYETDLHRSEARQSVTLAPGSTIADIYAERATEGVLRVNSYHHQAVLEPGSGLSVAALAEDGTVEAVEMDGKPIVGLQWHPEMHAGIDPIFEWLVGVSQD